MNPAANLSVKQVFTLIELLVVVAIIFILFSMTWHPHGNAHIRVSAIGCMNNLKQISLGYIIWAEDHTNRFPWEVSTNDGGSLEQIVTGNTINQVGALTNFLNSPGIFVCPADPARQRTNSYVGFNLTNLSYFVAVNLSFAAATNPAALILAGDRCLSFSNQPVRAGLFETTNFAALGWQPGFHKTSTDSGSALAFVDGHAAIEKSSRLPATFQAQNIAANRLVIP